MELLKVDKHETGVYKVSYYNGVYLGEFVTGDDGYLVYFPSKRNNGFWSSSAIRAIADKLDELNKPWDDVIQKITIEE